MLQNPPFKGPETIVPSEVAAAEQREKDALEQQDTEDTDEIVVITLRLPRWLRNYVNSHTKGRLSTQRYCFNTLIDKFKQDHQNDLYFMNRLKIFLEAKEALEKEKILKRPR